MKFDQSKISSWKIRLDMAEETVINTYGQLSWEQFNHKPAPDKWSIAEIIAHLIQVSRSYEPIFESIANGKYRPPLTGKISFLSRWLGKTILRSVMPESERKYKTMPVWQPIHSNYDLSLLDTFRDAQHSIIRWMDAIDILASKSATVTSPGNDKIAYPLDMVFEIIVTHEERHLQQAGRVYEMLMNKALGDG